MAPNPADPIVIVAKILAIAIGIELASALAPQVVVLLAGATGSVFGLLAWRQCSRLEALGYVFLMTAMSWLFAGSVSTVLAARLNIDSPMPLLAAAACCIAWVGHRWPAVALWAVRRFAKPTRPLP